VDAREIDPRDRQGQNNGVIDGSRLVVEESSNPRSCSREQTSEARGDAAILTTEPLDRASVAARTCKFHVGGTAFDPAVGEWVREKKSMTWRGGAAGSHSIGLDVWFMIEDAAAGMVRTSRSSNRIR